jgi:class 3 adenylate cyclase
MPPQPPTSSIENENAISQSSRRRLSVFGNTTKPSNPPSSTQLNVEKFEQALAPDFVSGFEETEECFTRITTRAASLLGADKCFVFVKDNNEQQLYTFLKDIDGNKVIVVKPINRGITGSILADPTGFNESNIGQCQRWLHEVDELPNFVTTCYLAWPIWDFAACKSIGVIEFRNKLNGLLEFNAADSQFARIIALQLGHGFIHYKQQKLIHGHTEAINQAYEKNYDLAETIELASSAETLALIETGNKNSRRPYTTARQPSPSLFDIRRSSVSVVDRAWDYDVFVKSDEELMMHAIDIFDERGLFSRFLIPITTFVNFVNEVKKGYDSNAPYHNSYHAFDVMHVCYLLLTKCAADEYLESFNVLSILVAALAHDLGHDGYNNSFHQSTGSDLALTYNGISVQENYSASYLFRILRKPECNIFARLNDEEMSKMRTRLIDMILDTDAKNHFMLMTRFKHALELKKLSRGLLSSMILHVADVSNPTRPGKVSRKWAYVVQSEFFRQGDKEKELNMKRSPFMDREFENLPRMQVAFIDAVVQPVFKLFADFLPLVEGQCLKPLVQNRAFWQSMLHRTTIKTDEIKVFLDHEEKDDSDVDESQDDGNSIKSSDDAAVEPIPGIPADATKDNSPLRRMSVISLNADTKRLFDPEVGIKFDDKKRIAVHNSNRGVFQAVHNGMKKVLNSTIFQTFAFVATIYGLFASDLSLALGNKDGDFVMDVATLVVFIVFVFELLMSLVCVPTYFHFFFWLDLVATISMYFEIGFFSQSSSLGSNLALAKAGRAAKAGARAGRLVSILRLIRLVKIFKFAKLTLGRAIMQTEKQVEVNANDTEKDLTSSMSIIGRKMTESITKKVIIVVVLMIGLFSLTTEVDYTPDARQLQLDSIAEYPDSTVLLDSLFESHDNIIAFSAGGVDFVNQERLDDLRDTEVLSLSSKSDNSIYATFDISDDTVTQAWISILITSFVSVLLATMGFLFSRDAHKMVIRPIEMMKYTVQQLSENPLLHLEKIKHRETNESNETDILNQAITKMGALLQVGFGSAGAEIIGKNLSDLGELNPMIPGVRVNAIFGFCDIRDFTFATEGLQQDVMIFVNKIAEITHRHVINSGGHPNKNIGDAFLLVWKLKSGKNTHSSGDTQKGLFDSALNAMQKVVKELRQAGSLATFLKDETQHMSSAWESSLASYKVAMGVGLHKGWAIEGAIGSKVKIDASYLSPHVNLASRLESATKKYNVPLLMSEAFFGGLSGSIQSTCRRCDRVSFKGSTDPMVIYHQDIEPLSSLQFPTQKHSKLLEITMWDKETETNYRGLIKDAQSKLQSTSELVQREVFDALFNSYIDKDWRRCKILCHLWIERFPGDVIVIGLAERLSLHDFQCPETFLGYNSLTEK